MQTSRIQELYPSLSDEELQHAEEKLKRYLESTLELYERITYDPATYARFKALTAAIKDSYDDGGQKVECS